MFMSTRPRWENAKAWHGFGGYGMASVATAQLRRDYDTATARLRNGSKHQRNCMPEFKKWPSESSVSTATRKSWTRNGFSTCSPSSHGSHLLLFDRSRLFEPRQLAT